MTPKQVMEELLAGKKVRRPHWDNDTYIYISGDGAVVNQLGQFYAYTTLTMDEWEIYEPPKQLKTKTMWKSIFKRKESISYEESDAIFDSYESAMNATKCFVANYDFVGAISIEVHHED